MQQVSDLICKSAPVKIDAVDPYNSAVHQDAADQLMISKTNIYAGNQVSEN